MNLDSAVEPSTFQGQCGILQERRRSTYRFNGSMVQPIKRALRPSSNV
jgi:hypothetical protein